MSTFKNFISELSPDKPKIHASDDDIADELITLFTKKSPSDAEVHNIAVKFGVSDERAEEIAYAMLHSFLSKFGKHNNVSDDQFDAEQLKIGIKIEHEHIDNDHIAQLIAKDHLAELPDYYSRLEKMEKDDE